MREKAVRCIGSFLGRKQHQFSPTRFHCIFSPLSHEKVSNRVSCRHNTTIQYGTEEQSTSSPLRYRYVVNQLAREISEEGYKASEPRLSLIEQTTWSQYVNRVRRDLIKRDVIENLTVEEIEKRDDRGNTPLEQLDDATDRIANDIIKSEENLKAVNAVIRELIKCDTMTQEAMIKQYKDDIFKLVVDQAVIDLADIFAAHSILSETSDLRIPHEWYPYARMLKRKIIYHGGPTNSGKTYSALLRLKDADIEKGGGLYCGPLRLLSLEVFESLNRQGVYTSLLTGQEKREVPGASHTSCTLEMVNLYKEYDVAVIDEIQMISNSDRGYAWTRALLGLRAREIHVCGGLEASDICKDLALQAGDDFELRKYERLSDSLVIHDESFRGDYKNVRPGDTVVAFSKADIFSIRKQIELVTPYKCSIIYGQLPPETRSTQARLFNEGVNDVLVASDAIGMGLNLNIGRIVFHTTLKQGSRHTGPEFVDPSSIKQIAGRAGRRNSKYKVGEVTSWQDIDLAYVKAVMNWDIPQIKSAGIFPSVEQVELFSDTLADMMKEQQSSAEDVRVDEAHTDTEWATVDNELRIESSSESKTENETINKSKGKKKNKKNDQDSSSSNDSSDSSIDSKSVSSSTPTSSSVVVASPTTPISLQLSSVMERFVKSSQLDGRFFMCDHEAMNIVSNWLHSIPLSMTDKFIFSNAPINIRDTLSMNVLYQFAATYARNQPVPLNIRLSRTAPRDIQDFSDLCIKHNTLDLYIWLSFRFPQLFISRESCLEQKNFAIQQIESTLNMTTLRQEYSHNQNYKLVRDKALKLGAERGCLPPLQYGATLQKATKRNLSQIPLEKLYIV